MNIFSTLWFKLAVAAALLAVGGLGAWIVRDTMAEAEVMTMRQDFERERREAVETALRAQKKAFDEERDKMTTLARIDKEQIAKLKGELNENEKLRKCLSDGTCGLRIRAARPATDHVPGTQPGSGVDSGGTAKLDGEAERAYLSLRSGIVIATRQLAACQAALKNITGQ